MGFVHERVGVLDLNKHRISYKFAVNILELANDKKFDRFQLSQFSATSELFCLSWVETVGNQAFFRTMEHWDLEVIYNAIASMYKDSKYAAVKMDVAFDEANIYMMADREEDNGEDLL